LRGDWHLWIHNCFWRLLWNGEEALFCEDDREDMRPILNAMSGAQLESVGISGTDRSTRFTFDLGWVLETSPYESAISVHRLGREITTRWGDEATEQWMLFEPSGMVLSLDNYGTVGYERRDASTDSAPTASDAVAVRIELTDDERELLARGLLEWGGPTRGTTATAEAMGFGYMTEVIAASKRIAAQLRAETGLTPRDWARALIATELVFASDYYGAGVEWQTTTGMSDQITIQCLRGVQRKLAGIAKLS
jgi:hypothetical protein